MNIFSQNPGGYALISPLLQQNVGQPINITSTEQDVKLQVGGSVLYGETRPSFPGEKHVYMKTDAGLVRSNWAGPGTNVGARLTRGDLPINEVDRISKAHDLRYALANDYDEVRSADRKMVAALDRVKDKDMHTRAAKALIKAKMGLENARIVKKGFFAQHGSETDPVAIQKLKTALAPLEQEGLGGLFPGDAGTDQYYKSSFSGKVKKGSQEARDRMAKLRAMRKKGKGLKLAGDGLKIAGGRKKFPRKKGGAVAGIAALALPTLAGIALKALASHGIKKGVTSLINKIRGRGLVMAGNGIKGQLAKMKALFHAHVAGPLKEQALGVLEKIKSDPAKHMEEGMKILGPILVKMAGQMSGTQAGSGYSEDGMYVYLMKQFGKDIMNQIKKMLGSSKETVVPSDSAFHGLGLIGKVKGFVEKTYGDVDSLISKAPVGEAVIIRQILTEIKNNPTAVENPAFLASVAQRLSPTGQRLLNTLLRKAKIPVQLSLTR